MKKVEHSYNEKIMELTEIKSCKSV
jgi:hypothetical protein